MTLDSLLAKFNQHWQARPLHDYPYPNQNRPAAVLIAMHSVENELRVLFTKRAEHLLHHPGQISFPGGKYEDSDASLIDTAIREAHEEIGLAPENVKVIGQLPSYKTVSGFEVKPILAFVESKLDIVNDLVIDQGEVAEVFDVPLAFLMQPNNLLAHMIERKGKDFPVYFIPFEDRYIWGATAGIIASLQYHLIDEPE
jgi:8-oxo-dGTP pyrophosphatase MutT (NUDIX family)